MTRTKALTLAELGTINRMAALRSQRLQDYFAKVALVAGDGKKEAREQAKKCPWCFYLDHGLAGQAFTDWKCGLCSAAASHPNTHVPHVCDSCADIFGLCTQCGSTRNCQQKSRFDRKARRVK